MNSKIKNINTFTREVSVNVPWENLKDDFKKCFFDFKKGYSMPGFRKGKVPDAIVKKNYGPAIEADFTEKSINKFYQISLQELKLIPINKAEIKNLEFNEGDNLKFKAVFEVTPDFKIPDYKKKYKIPTKQFVYSKRYAEKVLSLPVYPKLTNNNIKFICKTISKILI